MFTVKETIQPETLEDAFAIVSRRRNNVILGGCTFLRLGHMAIGTAVDLAKMGLDFIREDSHTIEIVAMTTLRELETHPLTVAHFNGILPKASAHIIGVQFRNSATVGASVFSRYGFSDIIAALSVLDTAVELYRGGRMPLGEFLARPYQKDILTRVIIPKNHRLASYQSLRSSASDFPILNAAASYWEGQWTIAVGARPNVAAVATQAARFLTDAQETGANIEQAAKLAASELSFGTNMRGSADYRQAMCEVLVKRAIGEVLACK